MSELHADRAAALGRIGGTLQNLIETLQALRAQLRRLPGDEREGAIARYETLHERARLYRWYLEVQRESLGLTRHDLIDAAYKLPPAKPI
jgi:hypothetical protein